jgi:ribosomal protein S18 acetylase RimI-like enzyme
MNDLSISVVPIAEEHAEGFRRCLDAVARERAYLGFLEAPALERIRGFVCANIAGDLPQFVAVCGGEVVGWCDVSPEELPGFTHCGRLGMGVRMDCRRRGVGKRLLKAALEKAKAKGIERIELEVYASNRAAISLYERSGFVSEGVKRKGRKLDGRYDDVVFMAKWIGDPEPPPADPRGGGEGGGGKGRTDRRNRGCARRVRL